MAWEKCAQIAANAKMAALNLEVGIRVMAMNKTSWVSRTESHNLFRASP